MGLMALKKRSKSSGGKWFAIRRSLSPRRRLVLSVMSFLGPLLIWSIISYTPFLWHPDMRITISADVEDMTTVYTAGNRVGKPFFRDNLLVRVRAENEAILAAREAGSPLEAGRRANLKILRHLAPWGVANGFLSPEQSTDDPAIFELWKRAAEGDAGAKLTLSEENLRIVAENWRMLEPLDADRGVSGPLPTESLLKLVPQGISSNPPYLPAPHEVLVTGWKDFTAENLSGGESMPSRMKHSVRIVFWGFFWAAIIGVPLAVACGTFDFFSRLFEPFFDFFRYMPAPTFSTLLVAVMGLNDAPKIALVFVGTFFQLVLVIANTSRLLDHSLIEASQTLGAKRFNILFRVIVPGILPQMYNDLRILLGWAWTWLVIAELIGTKSGLTEFIETQGRFYKFDRVYPVIISIGVIGFFTDQVLAWLRPFLFPWTGESQGKLTRSLFNGLESARRWLVPEYERVNR
jgi:NitT/TauT family transport system permease protein